MCNLLSRFVSFIGAGAMMLTACTPAPTPTAVAIVTLIATTAPQATATAQPTATATLTPTPTATATSTPTPTHTATATATLEPTATATLAATATPRQTATPRPTEAPATATTAPAGPSVPPPLSFEFTPGGFMQYLDYAHKRYQMMLGYMGGVFKGDYIGSCNAFNIRRNDLMAIVAFTNVPDQWKAMVDEYHNLRSQAFIVTDPIHQLCQGSGGTISDETARSISDLLDRAQNRMYEMLQQARAMTQ